jgi:hypothetical protein
MDQAIVEAKFGDSKPDVIVHINCHGNLIIDTKMRDSSDRFDSYDLFSFSGFVDNILMFMLSGVGNSACDIDPMVKDFPTNVPDATFVDIFKGLNRGYNDTNSERSLQYETDLKAPLGSYSILPFIEGQQLTNVFINKYVFIGEDEDDIYIIDNEGNRIRISDLNSVAKLLAKKLSITHYAAVDLVELAVTVDSGLVAGWDILIPGGFNDERRILNGRIQRITLREVFYLLYLLGYKNPLILDDSCTGNYSRNGPQAERLAARTAAKHHTPFIDVGEFLIVDNKKIVNLTFCDKNTFDEKCNRIIESNKEYINYIIENVPGCSEKLALFAADAIVGVSLQINFIHAVLYLIKEFNFTEEQAVEGIMATKNPDGTPNPDAAKDYLTSSGGKRIKKTMKRKRYRKTIKRNTQRSKKSIKRKAK